MKIKKIVMVGLAAFSLGLSACTKPDPGEPVKKIAVSKVTDAFIVGDTVDLDDYVNVEGGKGEKVYTATAAKGSETRVEFGTGKNAHKFTILEEGSIKINVVAENLETKKTATFTCEAYGELKATFLRLTKGLSYNYGFDAIEEDETTGEEIVVEYIRHNKNYYYDTWMNADNQWVAKNSEGFIKYIESGKAYDFTAVGPDCSNLVIGERDESFDYYFCNFPWLLTSKDVTSEVDANGESYLSISGTKAAPDADYWASLAEEFAYNSLAAYPAGYGYICSSVDIFLEEDASGNQGLIFKVMAKETKTAEPEVFGEYRFVAPEDAKVAVLEDEIKTGAHEPAAISTSELVTAWDLFQGADNYTVNFSQFWIDDDGNKVDLKAIAETITDDDELVSSLLSLDNAYPEDYEEVVYDKTIGRISTGYTANGEKSGAIKGWADKEGTLYDFSNAKDETTGEWGAVTAAPSSKTLANLNDLFFFGGYPSNLCLSYFDPMTRSEKSGVVTWTYDNSSNNAAWIEPLLLQSEFHYNQNCGFLQQEDSYGYYYRFLTGSISATATSIVYTGSWGFSDLDYRIFYSVELSNANTTVVDASSYLA